MKKILQVLIITSIITLLFPGVVLAEKQKGILKGEIIAVSQSEGTITILTEEGNTTVVQVPLNFDFDEISVGAKVHVKVQQSQNGSVVEEWIKEVNKGEDENESEKKEKGKEGLEGKYTSSYCSGEKEKEHPFATAIAETYGASVSDVMGFFCNGFGFGEIMLALQTHQMNGEGITSMLDLRKSGQGWGQIWQELGLIGNPDKAKSPPPEQLKKANQTEIE